MTDQPLVFAVVSGSSAALEHLGAMCAEIERALARPVIPSVLPSNDALAHDLAAGLAQIAWAPPLVALELVDADVASADLVCTRGGSSGYHAALFTRHDSAIEKLADLKGRHVAWVDAHSSAGYLLPRLHLAAAGLDVTALFGRESFLGTHAGVAVAVLDGTADVGATYVSLDRMTDRPVSAGWLEAGAGINGAFILATAGPIPADAILFSNRLGADLKAALAAQLMALPATVPRALRKLLRADGFAARPATHFEGLRALQRSAAPRG